MLHAQRIDAQARNEAVEPFVELMNIAESLSLTPDMPAPEPGNPETDLAAATAAATELSEAGIAAQT